MSNQQHQLQMAKTIVIGLALIIFAVVGCQWFSDWPNAKPLAAVSLFCGLLFSRFSTALSVAFLAILAGHLSTIPLANAMQIALAATVTACLMIPLVLARFVRGRKFASGAAMLIGYPMCLAATTILGSILFFLITNLAFWAFLGYYPRTWGGLVTCYAQALPFFRATLVGDFLFVSVLGGSTAVLTAVRCFLASQRLWRAIEPSTI